MKRKLLSLAPLFFSLSASDIEGLKVMLAQFY